MFHRNRFVTGKLGKELDWSIMAKTKLPPALASRLHRVTDLFKTGRAIILNDEDPDDPVVVWIQKLNSFQRSDALRDAEYGRARRMASLTENTEEIRGVRLRLTDYDDDKLIENILNPRSNEFWGQGRDDVLADKSWEDKLAALRDHTQAEEDGSYIPEEERQRVEAMNTEFLAAVTGAMEVRTQDAVRDLKSKTREERENEYVEAYRRLKGAEAWQDEYNRTEVWYCLRDCIHHEVRDINDHVGHQHPQLLERRALVYELPDELVESAQEALRELSIPMAEAGNSDAPRSSSASSERHTTVEDSTPSTPAETSTEPPGNSSTPSTPETKSSDG